MKYGEFKSYVQEKSEICKKWESEEACKKFFEEVDISKSGSASQQLIDQVLSSPEKLSKFTPKVSLKKEIFEGLIGCSQLRRK